MGGLGRGNPLGERCLLSLIVLSRRVSVDVPGLEVGASLWASARAVNPRETAQQSDNSKTRDSR